MPTTANALLENMDKCHIRQYLNARCEKFEEDGVTVNQEGKSVKIPGGYMYLLHGVCGPTTMRRQQSLRCRGYPGGVDRRLQESRKTGRRCAGRLYGGHGGGHPVDDFRRRLQMFQKDWENSHVTEKNRVPMHFPAGAYESVAQALNL